MRYGTREAGSAEFNAYIWLFKHHTNPPTPILPDTVHVYVDNAATTALDERVLEVMLPYMRHEYANANSPHRPGRTVHVAVEQAREVIAGVLGAEPAEIIFTSGGTESNNAVIYGTLNATEKRHIITSSVEHHAVLHPIQDAARMGAHATILKVTPYGGITLEQVEQAIQNDTALVSIIHGNNEVGTLNPVTEIGLLCQNRGIPLHSDTVQTVGKIPVNVDDLHVDFLSLSAHKFYGPKGVGALYVRGGTPWKPWMHGGSQERKRRAGTLNVAGIVGMAKALELAVSEMEVNALHIEELKRTLMRALRERLGEHVTFNGHTSQSLYNIVNCSFIYPDAPIIDGEMLLLNLDIEGIYCSNGSACTSGAIEASHVLLGMDIPYPVAKSSIRFSLSKHNTQDEMHYIAEKTEAIIRRMTRTL